MCAVVVVKVDDAAVEEHEPALRRGVRVGHVRDDGLDGAVESDARDGHGERRVRARVVPREARAQVVVGGGVHGPVLLARRRALDHASISAAGNEACAAARARRGGRVVQGGDRYKDCITIKEFDQMKKTTFLINTSRGPIVNEDDLIIALSTNVIMGAGIDVYEKEPLPEGNKLRFLPNALLTPHIGYVTAENYSIFYTQMIEDLEACISGKPIRVIEK